MDVSFVEWLREEMNQRGWSQSELSRQADLTPTAISDVFSGKRNPGIKFCVAIASAFKIPVEEVLSHAGHLKPTPVKTAIINRIIARISEVTDPEEIKKIERLLDVYLDGLTRPKSRKLRGTARSARV